MSDDIGRALADGIRAEMLAAGVPEQTFAKFRETGEGVWTTETLGEHFEVEGFAAPFVVVRRKEDGQRGSLMFTHRPRFYFDFTPAGS